ncbi:transcription factor TFIIF complex subunit Tfg3 [Entomophthora muscae]|uniref:Transcription factor TFIIF complex subunit Tfg3 n=1 Tax=Entomophthora muscae TaxID=34485 RepID=A0ACC2TBC1_9FUNG|nr:transcription factor TFIIF complex subunit Tfg3 [Entomophthora muscae]
MSGTIHKNIIITTQSRPLRRNCPKSGHPISNWKVDISTLDAKGTRQEKLPFISHVIFKLHGSFARPLQVVRASPFKIIRCGWGSFSMPITLYFVDSDIEPIIIMHYLNLSKGKYTISKSLDFYKVTPEFVLLLQGDATFHHNYGSKTAQTFIKKPKVILEEYSLLRWQVAKWKYALSKQHKVQEKIFDINFKLQTALSNSPLPKNFTHEKLAKELILLKGNHIKIAVGFIKEAQSKETFIDETKKGKFTFDIYTLGNSLLLRLWDYTKENLRNSDKSSYFQ